MKKLNIFLAACCVASSLSAQEVTVKSQIKGTDGQPVSGAIISVKGQKSTALSDASGRFELKSAGTQAIVLIKAPGFYEAELPLTYLYKKSSNNAFSITLIPEKEALYAPQASKVESKDFNEKSSLGGVLRDGVAGLQTIEKSGMPGEGTYMNIRGIHSFIAENNPLIVINGIPFLGNQNVSDVINGYSRDLLFGYDPKDIKSVTVLKGAEAAQWGSLGSNGVIKIETQQATSDNLDTRISFSGNYGMNFRHGTLPVLGADDYRRYMGDIGMSRYASLSQLTNDYPFLSNSASPYSYLFNENTNWMDEIQRTGFTTENLFRVEGGDEIAKYNISFGYSRNEGTLKNTNSDKYHTLISSDVMVSRKIDIFANIGLSYITSNLNNMGMQLETNPLLAAYRAMPLISPNAKQSDGSVLSTLASYNEWNAWNSNPTFAYDDVSNPTALATTVLGSDKIYDVNMHAGLNYKWNDYLTLTGLVNLYYNYTEETMFIPGMTNQAILPQKYGTGKNKVGNGVTHQRANTYQIQADYKRLFNHVHDIQVQAYGRVITRKLEIDVAEGYNTANDYYQTLGNTQNEKDSWGSNLNWNYLSFGLNVDYTYNQLVRVQAGLAADATSASGSDASRLGLFPYGKATFMAAHTGVLPTWINKLDINVGASLTGNSRFSSNYGKNYYVSGNVFDIGSIVRSNVPNTKLSWEKKRQLDLGLDLGLLQNKIQLGVDFFTSESYDLLLNRDISEVYGSKMYYDNTGKISGKGMEVSLRVNPIHTKDFDLVIAANMATVKNEVKSLGGDPSITTSYKAFNNDDAQTIMTVGGKPYEFYGYKTNGIYATSAEAAEAGLVNANGKAYQAGDVRFVDVSGPDGTPDGIINEYDKVSLGSTMPTLFGGLNLMVRYREWSLSANFGYTVGNKIYNATRRQLESMTDFTNQSAAVLNRWQYEGQQTSTPRAAYGDPSGNNDFSDRWIERGDYFKLRSLKLSYAFKNLFGLVRTGNVYVEGENLFSITKYLGSDPEFAYSYSESLRGFDYAKLALPATVKIGFNLNF